MCTVSILMNATDDYAHRRVVPATHAPLAAANSSRALSRRRMLEHAQPPPILHFQHLPLPQRNPLILMLLKTLFHFISHFESLVLSHLVESLHEPLLAAAQPKRATALNRFLPPFLSRHLAAAATAPP
jgi:hypothetical protein